MSAMKTEWTYSLEGWNFDSLMKHTHKWQKVGNRNMYVSDLFTHGNLYLQLIKSYDRVVALIDRNDKMPVIFKLGNWSRTTSRQLTMYANEHHYILLNVELMSKEAIDVLQGGL